MGKKRRQNTRNGKRRSSLPRGSDIPINRTSITAVSADSRSYAGRGSCSSPCPIFFAYTEQRLASSASLQERREYSSRDSPCTFQSSSDLSHPCRRYPVVPDGLSPPRPCPGNAPYRFREMRSMRCCRAGWMYISSLLPRFRAYRNPAARTPATTRKKRMRTTGSAPERSVRWECSMVGMYLSGVMNVLVRHLPARRHPRAGFGRAAMPRQGFILDPEHHLEQRTGSPNKGMGVGTGVSL